MTPNKKPTPGKKPSSSKNTSKSLVNWPLSILLAAAGGTLILLSFPRFDLFPLAWFGPACLVVALKGKNFIGAFLLGLLAGFIANMGGFYWISNMLQDFAHMSLWLSWVLTCLLVLVQGLLYAFAAAISAGVIRKYPSVPWLLVFPIAYTAFEFAFPLIFPWYIANGQQLFTAAIQIADLAGAPGITFVLVFVSTAIGEIVASRIGKTSFPVVGTILAVLVMGGTIVYGVMRIDQVDRRVADAPKFRIGIVEANIGIWEKEAQNPDGSPLDGAAQMAMLYSNLLKHQYLSQVIEKEHHPDLIVWPESSYFPLYRVFAKRTSDTAMVVSLGGTLYGFSRDGIAVNENGTEAPFRDSGLSAISARNEESILAVGPAGAVYFFDGQVWTREKTDTDRNLNAVAWTRGSGAVAVGDNGVVLVRHRPEREESGTTPAPYWQTVDTGRNTTLRGVVDTEQFGTVACGDGGTLISVDNGEVRDLVPAGLPDLTAVGWTGEGGVVAVGHLGTIVRVKGLNEVTSEQPTTRTLRAVSAGSVTWAVGDDGEVVACTDQCRKVATGVRRNLNAVAGLGGDGAVAVGDEGVVLRLSLDGPHASMVEGARGRLVGITDIPFLEAYPYPLDTRKIYVSRTPLPSEGTFEDPMAGFLADRRTSAADRNAAIRGFTTPVIFGAATMERFPPEGREPIKHNTAMMVDGNGDVLGMYFKTNLLVFGEYLPFEKWFPFLRKQLPEAGDWTPGDGPRLWELGDARIGISICYEGLMAQFHREQSKLRPNVLINITNDAWFGKTREPWLHLQLAELRSVETRTYMVRSTNTGISAFVDPVGRRVAHTELEGAEYLVQDVALTSENTIYMRYGDAFAWACCGLTLLLACLCFIPRRKS